MIADDWDGEPRHNGEAMLNGSAWSDKEGEREHVQHFNIADELEPLPAQDDAMRRAADVVREFLIGLKRAPEVKIDAALSVFGLDPRPLAEIAWEGGYSVQSLSQQRQRIAGMFGIQTTREHAKGAYSDAARKKWRKRRTAAPVKKQPLEMDSKTGTPHSKGPTQ